MAHAPLACPGGGGGTRPAGRRRPLATGAEPAPWQTLLLLRGAALIGALGLAFLLDDPARHLTVPVPTPRLVRQVLRVALVAPLAVLWWTAALLLTPRRPGPRPAGSPWRRWRWAPSPSPLRPWPYG